MPAPASIRRAGERPSTALVAMRGPYCVRPGPLPAGPTITGSVTPKEKSETAMAMPPGSRGSGDGAPTRGLAPGVMIRNASRAMDFRTPRHRSTRYFRPFPLTCGACGHRRMGRIGSPCPERPRRVSSYNRSPPDVNRKHASTRASELTREGAVMPGPELRARLFRGTEGGVLANVRAHITIPHPCRSSYRVGTKPHKAYKEWGTRA